MVRHGDAPYLECSTKGDKRFSAFCARVNTLGGRTIEELYQGFKIFPDGRTGLTWREAKGLQAVNQQECADFYTRLWRCYILVENPHLQHDLLSATGLSDIFGQKDRCCQATELWKIRQELLDNA